MSERKQPVRFWQGFACISIILLATLLAGCELRRPAPSPTQPSAAAPGATQPSTPTLGPIEPSPAGSGQTPARPEGPLIRVVPESQRIERGQTTRVDILIENVTELWGAQVDLQFDPAVLQVKDADPSDEGVQIQVGEFPVPDVVHQKEVDTVTGIIEYTVAQEDPREPASGSGLLASITFEGVNEGASDLNLIEVKLSNLQFEPILPVVQESEIAVGGVELPSAAVSPTPMPVTATLIAQVTPSPLPSAPTPTPMPEVTPTATPAQAAPVPTEAPVAEVRYVVRRGDTLSGIAWRYGVSIWELAANNGIRNIHRIYVGQVLVIPGSERVVGDRYVVKWGDTLFSIARRHGLSVWQLASYNRIRNPNRIYAGQVIHIPPR